MRHYIFIVDSHYPRKHHTAGIYVVFAKNPKVGKQILKSAIKFGRIQFWGEYENHPEWNSVFPRDKGFLQIKNMLRNTCFKVEVKVINGKAQTKLLTPTSDTACQHKNKED